MSHWFHRNPLKATLFVKFELKTVLTKDELRLRRDKFLNCLQSASNDLETVEKEFEEYLSILYGFLFKIEEPVRVEDFHENVNEKVSQSKLRYLEEFIWTNSMLYTEALASSDFWFEALNICINTSLWYMKRAAWISSKDEVNDVDAKQIHTLLCKAAGIFKFVLNNSDKLSEMHKFVGNDIENNVLEAYINQCIAEAQEVTIARAIELKHAPKLISTLSTETALRYQSSAKFLECFPAENFEKWRLYFQLKHHFYLAYAYAYLSESLIAEDNCGQAVRACQEGIASYKITESLCKKYDKTDGPGFSAKPENHLFFRRIELLLNRHLDKANMENSFIYHQKVPTECSLLNSNASFGLAKFHLFNFPKPSVFWNTLSYAAFDITKAIMPSDFGKVKKHNKSIPPIKEEKCYATDKDPTNFSGCSIS